MNPDPLSVTAFTAPGQPFELIEREVRGMRCRVFRNARHFLGELYGAAREHDGRVFAVQEGTRFTYGELFAQAGALAAELANQGVTKGVRVAIVMRNCPEWLVAFIAVTALGAVPVLVNSRAARPELSHCVASTRSRHIIADAERAQLMEQAGALDGTTGILVAQTRDARPHWRHWSDIVGGAVPRELPLTACAPEDPALIMFTSGTTGTPKGAVLDHLGVLTALMANQLSAAVLFARIAAQLAIDPATLAANAPQPCTLLVFPLTHTSGCLSVFLTSLARGGKIVFMPRWSAAQALELIGRERVTSLPAVPTMLWDLLHAPELAGADISSLVNVATAGQSLPGNLLESIRAAFPRALLGTGYGMTETNGMVSLAVGAEFVAHPDSAGQPLATAEIRIVDGDDRELPQGVPGEVCVRSAQNMSGYFGRPEATAETFRGGWLHTGDVGFISAEGFLHLVGRKTDMIISGGENIYCAEVEQVLTQHPQVLEAATFGLPDERLGEKLVAVIVARGGCTLDASALREFCSTRLATYKLPREWVFDPRPLERNATGKVVKAQLRARLLGA